MRAGPIAFTTLDHGDMVFSGSEGVQVLLVDSVFESIAVKRIALRHGHIRRLWQRFKVRCDLQKANPDCAIYWCAVDRNIGYMCVSNLLLPDSEHINIQSYVERSTRLKAICSQLMSIGSALPAAYKEVLMVLNSPVGIRHVYFIDRKPVFTRLLSPNSLAVDYIGPLEATQQHLFNTGMLATAPKVVSHGLSTTAQAAISNSLPDSSVVSLKSLLGNKLEVPVFCTQPMSSLAVQAYKVGRFQRIFLGQLPCYWPVGLVRYRYRGASIQITAVACLFAIAFSSLVFAYKFNHWSELFRIHTAVEKTMEATKALQAKAAVYSSAPKITAQRLQRLDLLRSVQPVGPDVLLSSVSGVFETNPGIMLNHISWFTVVADEDLQMQTQITDRGQLSIDAVSPDYLSVLISGHVKGGSLSEQQALYGQFKSSLLSLQGIGDLIEEQTPVTQWRMPAQVDHLKSDISADSFTLRFSLNDVSS